MFICSSFIRKDTPELRGKLADIGYRMRLPANEQYAALLTTKKCVLGLPEMELQKSGHVWTLDIFIKNNPEIYDCGDSEDMFLGLASKGNENFMYSWIINNETSEWKQVLTTQDAMLTCGSKWRFASIDEIVEHFNS